MSAPPRAAAFILALLLPLLCMGLVTPAQAVPFSWVYSDTIAATPIAGLSAGDTATITVELDNGGTTNLGQTWTANDLQSLTWDFNNGGLVTTFTTPFDGGLFDGAGDFVTDGGGALTSVLTSWVDVGVTADFTTNGTGTNFTWFLNGFNHVYEQNGAVVELTNVGNMLTASNWSAVSAVPIPGTFWLFAGGLLALLGYDWRRRQGAIQVG